MYFLHSWTPFHLSPFRLLLDQHNASILLLETPIMQLGQGFRRLLCYAFRAISVFHASCAFALPRCSISRPFALQTGSYPCCTLISTSNLDLSEPRASREESHRLASMPCNSPPAQLVVAITVVAEYELGRIRLMVFAQFSLSSCLPLMTRKYALSRYILGYLVRRTLDNTTAGRLRLPLQG